MGILLTVAFLFGATQTLSTNIGTEPNYPAYTTAFLFIIALSSIFILGRLIEIEKHLRVRKESTVENDTAESIKNAGKKAGKATEGL